MLKFAKIAEVDDQKGRVRVLFPELHLTSGWYFVLQRKTRNEKYYVMPDLDEQVVCLCSEDLEWGVVLGAIYSDLNTIPAGAKSGVEMKVFSDGTFVKYDTAGSEPEISINTPGKVKLTGDVEIKGDVSINGKMAASGDITSSGGNVSDKKGSMADMRETYNSHIHTCPSNGGPTTSLKSTMT